MSRKLICPIHSDEVSIRDGCLTCSLTNAKIKIATLEAELAASQAEAIRKAVATYSAINKIEQYDTDQIELLGWFRDYADNLEGE